MSKFPNASSRSVVTSKNNAPGGTDGVDPDTQWNLGAPGTEVGMKDRKHGICCGISATWIMGFVGGHSGAFTTSEFRDYFFNVLRFQGSYIKQTEKNLENFIDALKDTFTHKTKKFDFKYATAKNVKHKVSPWRNLWAGYVGIWGHAIAIGRKGENYYIMEPNFGLYVYSSSHDFKTDLVDYVVARRQKLVNRGETPPEDFKIWFYGKS